ncbi:MAG: oligoendopeptidase F [Roseiflexaceae bacterium]|nr:oligoendopeptidase F [Roseiflexaceae bacterium]
MTTAVPTRSEIPGEQTWDAASIFADDAAWEAEIAAIKGQTAALGAFQGRLRDGPATVALWLSALEQVMRSVYRMEIYASMHYNVDTGDQAAQAKQDRAVGVYARTLAAAAFAEPELLAIGIDTLMQWTDQHAGLANYRHYFHSLGVKASHVRSGEVEALLSAAGEPFQSATNIHAVLADADLRFAPAIGGDGQSHEITQGSLGSLLQSPDREIRRSAWENYADAHLAVKNTMAACLATGVKQDVFVAQARGYPSALEAALAANFIPPAVFHSLIDTFKQHLPTWHRYWRLRKRALGVEQLHVYDIKAPLAASTAPVPYATAIDWICAGMQPLGAEYVEIMRRGLEQERWVDIFPNKGKRMGAFSTGTPGTHPFILMNYGDDLSGMSTLAHELGHSMHSYYTWHNQPFQYSDYSIFVAEVASNFNQALVRDHLLKQNDQRDFQIGMIEEAMANFHRYFFIMPTLARFELEIHQRVEQGQSLTADSMIALMSELFAEGYGDELTLDTARIGSTWCQFSTHLYSNFYVYQYATGISAAHALANGVLGNQSGAVERYLGFLKTGSAAYPIDALRAAGVDMATPAAVEATFGVLAGYVERLEQLV